jgi:hypothetical protein
MRGLIKGVKMIFLILGQCGLAGIGFNQILKNDGWMFYVGMFNVIVNLVCVGFIINGLIS